MAYFGTQPNNVKNNIGLYTPNEILRLTKEGSWSGSLEFIAESTASSSTIDFVDKFSDYKTHFIQLIDCVPTTQTEFGIKFSNDSGSSYETSSYAFTNFRVYANNSSGERKSNSQSSIRLGGDVLSSSEFNCNFYVYNANVSSMYTLISSQCTFLQGTIYAQEFGGGSYGQAEIVNGIRIGEGTGATAFTSGTARLFGVKEL
ncbi:MAG: hypothetical protein Tp162SUR384061_5 [Prokaryotic dsDNA virus sp.]|nr:MAG: hypothetical protein Tp162SUR384061_5 [Prokaryotic dsDNA virus sp.]|tara:strand:- start:10989 stop:11594 length:606 start_codon:yes stop_codon:yes gene_type:complete